MRQLTFIGTGKLEWWDVPTPKIMNSTDAIIRPLAVARCDLDYGMITGSTPLPGPFAFGHECAGEVVEVGEGDKNVKVGDKVIVPFQISCGTCDHCRRGWTNSCLSVARGAAFGMKPLCGEEFGGALSEFMRVPFADHMLVPLPDDVRPEVLAGASDNIADAWRSVAPYMDQYPQASVLVLGSGRGIGLYAVQVALAKGASRVLYAEVGQGSETLRASASTPRGCRQGQCCRKSCTRCHVVTITPKSSRSLKRHSAKLRTSWMIRVQRLSLATIGREV